MQNANAKFLNLKFSGFLIMLKVVSLVLYNLHNRRIKYILQLLTCIYALDLFKTKTKLLKTIFVKVHFLLKFQGKPRKCY